MRNQLQSALAVSALLLSTVPSANAQDTNQWYNQYGSRSSLMGGAVVGGVRDTSAGVYNPGALGFVENESLSVSANAYGISKITLENGSGTGEDLESQSIKAVPTLVSGIHRFEDDSVHTFGYTLLARIDASQNYTGRTDRFQDVIQEIPGDEEFTGQVSADQSIREYWLGGSYAYRLSDNISLGTTLFGAIRQQKATDSYFVRAIYDEAGLTTVTSTNSFEY
ncbi:MAG: hypothetical protein KDD69_05930, partial [Bdellovibrionales bacterium]|nr:hypothetical protein [Bdellovibrionales bacterium]